MDTTLLDFLDDEGRIGFVVIMARYGDQWVFVRHRERESWEIPGGHVEPGEALDDAARRELWEECGAIDFDLSPVCDYSVDRDGVVTYGRLYLARVDRLGPLPDFEIAEIILGDVFPETLTYPEILPLLFERVAGDASPGESR